jgi:hypothetical protein
MSSSSRDKTCGKLFFHIPGKVIVKGIETALVEQEYPPGLLNGLPATPGVIFYAFVSRIDLEVRVFLAESESERGHQDHHGAGYGV